jgi:hypothetical protein
MSHRHRIPTLKVYPNLESSLVSQNFLNKTDFINHIYPIALINNWVPTPIISPSFEIVLSPIVPADEEVFVEYKNKFCIPYPTPNMFLISFYFQIYPLDADLHFQFLDSDDHLLVNWHLNLGTAFVNFYEGVSFWFNVEPDTYTTGYTYTVFYRTINRDGNPVLFQVPGPQIIPPRPVATIVILYSILRIEQDAALTYIKY